MEQWVERLASFLDIPTEEIRRIGGVRKKVNGRLDVALIQSTVRKGVVNDLVGDYGYLVVDECHHLPAASFEQVARRSKVKFVLVLSATPTRKDGHYPIVTMQCKPIRYRVDARKQAEARPFNHSVVVRPTAFRASEVDGPHHITDSEAYRRDRRKDLMLQEHGYCVVRFLAEDVGKYLDHVLDTLLRVLARYKRLNEID